jgi:hypothetical protein
VDEHRERARQVRLDLGPGIAGISSGCSTARMEDFQVEPKRIFILDDDREVVDTVHRGRSPPARLTSDALTGIRPVSATVASD